MKASMIGTFLLGAAVGGGVTFYYSHSKHGQSAAPTQSSLGFPTAPSALAASSKVSAASPAVGASIAPDVSTAPSARQELASSVSDPIKATGAPIPLRSEFDRVIKKYPNNTLHSKLEQEPRDPAWAPVTEEAYRNFFQGSQEWLRYGIPEVDCRMSICEVRLLAYGADKETDWVKLAYKSLPWLDGAFPLGFASDEQDGNTALIIHLIFQGRPGSLIKTPLP